MTRTGVGIATFMVSSALLSCADDESEGDGAFTASASTVSVSVGDDAGTGVDDSATGAGDDVATLDDAGDGTAADDDADGSDGDAGSDDGTTGVDVPFDPGLCGEAPPMGSPPPPAPPGYSGGACPVLQPGYNTGFTSGGLSREFALIVPNAVDDTGTYPLLFAWYHISGNAMDFVDDIQAQSLADAGRAIIVIPQDTGMFETVWPDTPLDIGQSDVDLRMFDDLYACISAQYPINSQCVSSVGVSAGGLWTSYLGSVRGQYLAANVTISGGHPSEFVGSWWPWNSPRKFATIVMWGGPTDVLGIDFNAASLNLLGDYTGSGHFVLRCEHTGGHGVPADGDGDPLQMALHFFRNHPFYLDGESPLDMGLPAFYPSYCQAI
ncbi:MAG TPA: hypothetical protein VFG69_03920 [Nannocystaceae bacterium]|nr:hypothetical protein [Nannocystaceae bacterium]